MTAEDLADHQEMIAAMEAALTYTPVSYRASRLDVEKVRTMATRDLPDHDFATRMRLQRTMPAAAPRCGNGCGRAAMACALVCHACELDL
ncbi:MAG: hypothetical protein M3Q55_09315 [Acidobacteriota bacterium]|nr:hypothetical protein [Acidobacteriota bacterium]